MATASPLTTKGARIIVPTSDLLFHSFGFSWLWLCWINKIFTYLLGRIQTSQTWGQLYVQWYFPLQRNWVFSALTVGRSIDFKLFCPDIYYRVSGQSKSIINKRGRRRLCLKRRRRRWWWRRWWSHDKLCTHTHTTNVFGTHAAKITLTVTPPPTLVPSVFPLIFSP